MNITVYAAALASLEIITVSFVMVLNHGGWLKLEVTFELDNDYSGKKVFVLCNI